MMMLTSKYRSEARRDYARLLSTKKLAATQETNKLLLMQSVEGHSCKAHGTFSESYRNSTLERIVLALDKDPAEIKTARQNKISEYFWFLKEIIEGRCPERCADSKGENLFGYNIFSKYGVSDPKAFLIGSWLGSNMDKYFWRKRAEEIYHITIGGGICCYVDLTKLAMSNLDLDLLADHEHSLHEIRKLERSNIINCQGGILDINSTFGYARLKIGEGVSDDLAILIAGLLYGTDAALGLFLADAVDTWDKYVPVVHGTGQDERIAKIINQHIEKIKKHYGVFRLPRKEELVLFIRTIAKSCYQSIESSSQRYMLQIDEKYNIPPIENYFALITKQDVFKMHIGHKDYGMGSECLFRQLKATMNTFYNHDFEFRWKAKEKKLSRKEKREKKNNQ